MLQPYVNKLANGKLEITISLEERETLKEELEKNGPIRAWSELLEWPCCNGWQIPPEETFALYSNPFVFTDDYSYIDDDENGTAQDRIEYGRVYYYPSYEVSCPIEELIDTGRLELNYID